MMVGDRAEAVEYMDETLRQALSGERNSSQDRIGMPEQPAGMTAKSRVRVAIAHLLGPFPRVRRVAKGGLHLYRRRRAVYQRVVTAPLYEMRESIEEVQTEVDKRLDVTQASLASLEAL